MSAAYLLAGATAATPREAFQLVLQAAHARAEWIDEACFILKKTTLPQIELPSTSLRSVWADQPGLDALLLQSMSDRIVNAQRRLILITQQARTRCAALILVGPQAVGIHNLSPQAQIHPLWTLPTDEKPLDQAASCLSTAGFELDQVGWISVAPDVFKAAPPFAVARPLPRSSPGLIFQLAAAARAIKRKTPLALLLSAAPLQPLRLVLVEKL